MRVLLSPSFLIMVPQDGYHTSAGSRKLHGLSWNAIVDSIPVEIDNQRIFNAIMTAHAKINSPRYGKGEIMLAFSGGSDSTVALDMLLRCDVDQKVRFCFYDTGIEFSQTLKFLDECEKRYGITIERYRPKLTVPMAVRKYGQPVFSKMASNYLYRLQKHGFTWDSTDYDELVKQYPRCQAALKWWCDMNGRNSKFNISFTGKYLREFIMQNPPWFRISDRCCDVSKKRVAHEVIRYYGVQLNITGIRKAEKGIRSAVFKSCFNSGEECDYFRPLYWLSDSDKKEYEKAFGVRQSCCYRKTEEDGLALKRTGCCCCPFAGERLPHELEMTKEKDPVLYGVVSTVFKDAHEYTKKYLDFVAEKKQRAGT